MIEQLGGHLMPTKVDPARLVFGCHLSDYFSWHFIKCSLALTFEKLFL